MKDHIFSTLRTKCIPVSTIIDSWLYSWSDKLQYAGMYNSFSMFADQYICSDKNKKISSADIKKAYHQYCILRDYEELNDNVWAQILKQKFMCSSSTIVEKNGDRCNRIRAYKGVALSPEIERLFTQEPPAPPVISVYQK